MTAPAVDVTDAIPTSTFEVVFDGPPGPAVDPASIAADAIERCFVGPDRVTPAWVTLAVRSELQERRAEWAGRFVEVEDAVTRRSMGVGRWIDRGDGTWALRITVPHVEAVDVDGKVVTLHIPADDVDPDVVDEIAQAYLDHGAVLVRTSTGVTPPITTTVTDPDDATAPGGTE